MLNANERGTTMKLTFMETECRDKISRNCTKTFMRKVQRGRPQVNCEACKAEKVPATTRSATATVVAALGKGLCPCGNEFVINPGRGRKPTKCNDCRTAGTVYRMDDDGELQAIRAEALAEEQREIREENGRLRAANLVEMMKPLLEKKHREVIVH
jgi:hypothetical protein